MITKDTIVVGVDPDLTLEDFITTQEAEGSLALVEAAECYAAIVKARISVAFFLAIFKMESQFGTLGICYKYNTHSPGNTRSSITLKGGPVITPQGTYMTYSRWLAGTEDLVARFNAQNYIYAKNGLVTIGQIMPIFAPSSDNNNPNIYINNIVTWMNKWIGNNEVTPVAIQIDDRSGQLAPGKSSDRGNYKIDELILHETSGPHDVRNAAPALARTLDDATISWFLTPRSDVSIHYLIGGENLSAPIYRLCPESQAAYHIIGTKGSVDGFSIDNHESIGIERMGQPNDNPGPNQTRALCELALDICRRNPRITPDRIFSHASLQPDRRDGNTLLAVVRQYVSDNLGVIHVTNEQSSKPAGDFTSTNISFQDPVTNFYVLGDFARYYQAHGGLEFFGRPISSMTGGDTRFPEAQYIQWFERARFEWHPKEGLVMLGLVGREAMDKAA